MTVIRLLAQLFKGAQGHRIAPHLLLPSLYPKTLLSPECYVWNNSFYYSKKGLGEMPCKDQEKYLREHWLAHANSSAQHILAAWLLAPCLGQSWCSKLRAVTLPEAAVKTYLMGPLHFPQKGNPPLFISSLVLQIQAEYFWNYSQPILIACVLQINYHIVFLFKHHHWAITH